MDLFWNIKVFLLGSLICDDKKEYGVCLNVSDVEELNFRNYCLGV